MIKKTYQNINTGNGVHICIDGNLRDRKIDVEVIVHDYSAHTYKKFEFPADKFAEALDFFNEMVEKIKDHDRQQNNLIICDTASAP